MVAEPEGQLLRPVGRVNEDVAQPLQGLDRDSVLEAGQRGLPIVVLGERSAMIPKTESLRRVS
jgi:hypothetical protein